MRGSTGTATVADPCTITITDMDKDKDMDTDRNTATNATRATPAIRVRPTLCWRRAERRQPVRLKGWT